MECVGGVVQDGPYSDLSPVNLHSRHPTRQEPSCGRRQIGSEGFNGAHKGTLLEVLVVLVS